MKVLHISLAMTCLTSVAVSQVPLAQADYSTFYQSFTNYSQTLAVLTERSSIYTFIDHATVHTGPCRESDVLAQLSLGSELTNIPYDEYFIPEDEINGYQDFWYKVEGLNENGDFYEGYIWGGDVAKSWFFQQQATDEDAAVLLGIAAHQRTKVKDFRAEVRIVERGKLLASHEIPGLCVFNQCSNMTGIRLVDNSHIQQHQFIVEATTMATGCWPGVEKAFLFWNGKQLDLIFHAEYTKGKRFVEKPFVIHNPTDTNKVTICRYQQEDSSFEPIWKCNEVPLERDPTKATKAVAAIAD